MVVIKEMALKPNVGSDRSWVYTAHDYSEGEPTTELLAVRFANSENAQEFKAKFEQAQKSNAEVSGEGANKDKEDGTVKKDEAVVKGDKTEKGPSKGEEDKSRDGEETK